MNKADNSLEIARSNLPEEPGVYKFFNNKGDLIYVGKAKNLKKRVNSYFNKQSGLNLKTKRLVKEIKYIEYALTNTEYDALLLENNLIKENQPRYNILLKDDKSFPFICILKERFPRIISTRRYNPLSGEYFGPYTSVVAMKNVLRLIRKLYTIRTCSYSLTEKNISAGKFKVCLEYHIGNCLGPCESLQNEKSYMQDIQNAREILKGNTSIVRQYFKKEMDNAASEMKFERAQAYKEKLDYLEKFHSKATVVNPKLSDIDVIGIVSDEKSAWINFFQVNQGAVVITRNVEIKKKLDEDDKEILLHALEYFKLLTRSSNKLILSNQRLNLVPDGFTIIVPRIGDKKKLVDLSIRNALEFKKEKILREEPRKNRTLIQLQSDLRLKEYPDHIECFDNSNMQGSNPVASMVCFRNGKPYKKDYRKFNIKTVEGSNDFASMEEIVYRRYKRLREESESYPQLIVIDGGKGQLTSAVTALKSLDLYGEIPLIGIAKRLEEIYYPDDSYPLHISKKSPSLKLLQQLRDEAHRFAITFHRQKRSKRSLTSELYFIEGIGKQTVEELLKKFKSLKKIKEAREEELVRAVGKHKASLIIGYFKEK